VSEIARFRFSFAPAYRLPAQAFGISPATAWVDVGARALDARFGPWRVSTPLANVTDVAVTGPYAFWKTAGPRAPRDHRPRPDVRDQRGPGRADLVSGPVRGLDPSGVLRHPELTVTVADVDRLAELLSARCERSRGDNRRA
jgi:hypothetical protein